MYGILSYAVVVFLRLDVLIGAVFAKMDRQSLNRGMADLFKVVWWRRRLRNWNLWQIDYFFQFCFDSLLLFTQQKGSFGFRKGRERRNALRIPHSSAPIRVDSIRAPPNPAKRSKYICVAKFAPKLGDYVCSLHSVRLNCYSLFRMSI